jgi:hypothetical protein
MFVVHKYAHIIQPHISLYIYIYIIMHIYTHTYIHIQCVCVCAVIKQFNTNSAYIPTHIAYCNVVMITKIYDTYKK